VYRVTVGITVRYGGADVRDGDFQEGRCPAGGAGGGQMSPHSVAAAGGAASPWRRSFIEQRRQRRSDVDGGSQSNV